VRGNRGGECKAAASPNTSSPTLNSCQPRLATRAGEQAVRLIIAEESLLRPLLTNPALKVFSTLILDAARDRELLKPKAIN
jgi:hypothetical protein